LPYTLPSKINNIFSITQYFFGLKMNRPWRWHP
jgi:hypothetical protein